MKRNQKGFTIIEVLLVVVLVALIAGGYFEVKKARHNLSNTVTNSKEAALNEAAKERKEKIKGSATAYTGQPECHQDTADSPVKSKGIGIYVGIDQTFKTISDTTGNKVMEENSPTNATFMTEKANYPLTLDAESSYIGANRSSMVFNFITLDKQLVQSLIKTKVTISYMIKNQSFVTPAFTIDDCAI